MSIVNTTVVDLLRQACVDQKLVCSKDRVLVAVSGGADSVALLRALCELKEEYSLQLAVVHVDHQMRPDSGLDALFVESLAKDLGLKVFVEQCNVPEMCAEVGGSLEEVARNLRYEAFQRVANHFSATAIATAHTADDQAETVMMRLLRGAGLTGLSAIPWKRALDNQRMMGSAVWVIRPLLGVWRKQLEAYLAECEQAYRTDSSNKDLAFMRNRIRHELLPFIEDNYNPRIREALAQLAEQSQTDTDLLGLLVKRTWKRLVKERSPEYFMVDTSLLKRQPKALQRQLMRQVVYSLRGDLKRFEFRHWLELESLIETKPEGTVVSLPGRLRFEKLKTSLVSRLEP